MQTESGGNGEDQRPKVSKSHISVCPKCNGPVFREHRRFIDRLISLLRPMRRYRCDAHICQWKGILPVGKSHD